MKRKLSSMIWAALTITCALCIPATTHAQPLEDGFKNPPREYGVRCWWWWLNSNVTKEAITRDLEAMKSKGFSGAMIFDAGGAEQGGNSRVPDGPTYASPEWRELYKHALAEGKRLGLKLGLSIQSGWNLGGPNVTPDFSAKQITFSETQIDGPVQYNQALPQPPSRFDYYKDICVLAYQNKQADSPSLQYSVNASSLQTNHPAAQALDGNGDTYWVSAGNQEGSGPSETSPQWIDIHFSEEQIITKIIIHAREGYGPKTAQLQFKNKQGAFETIQDIQCNNAPATTVSIPTTKTETVRLMITDSYDPRFRDPPRNVQIREIELFDQYGKTLLPYSFKKPIRDLQLKSMFHELGGSGPDCRFLLNHEPIVPGEEDAKLDDVINITEYLQADGKLKWDVPDGQWTVLRFGYTPTDAYVSTFSADWHGLVIDYLRKAPLERYWSEVVQQLIDDAGPLAGSTLMQLETDSWECGGMNWTDDFEELFKHYRGYDPAPYLPIFAGKIIEDREVSNRFLADFRKTLGDCVADNHYGHFAELAHERNLQIQPESGGPHAGPLDGIKNLSKNDIVMGEFWAPSPHRPKPNNRFFIKQSSSVAHVYGKKYVGAESFTTIGPHWNDVLWQAQKPSSDHEFCSGLNMVFFHTFTCSPKEMGLPGQEYFAGTHINPQVTWWDYSDGYINYLNRCQYMAQQGTFVADVLYYYGDHIPNIARLKEDDPAKILPGYDYDVCDENIVLNLNVKDGKVVVPSGLSYRLLVMPDHKVLSLAVLQKIEHLLQQGATILSPKPERLVSLAGGEASQKRFHAIADQLWGKSPNDSGTKTIGAGRLAWGMSGREFFHNDGVPQDFISVDCPPSSMDYIHYTIDGFDAYYVCNQTQKPLETVCAFRLLGKQPEIWSPVTGEVRDLPNYAQTKTHTEIPLQFTPHESYFIVFRQDAKRSDSSAHNFPSFKTLTTIEGPWQVEFDPQWGGPASVQFNELTNWAKNQNEGIKYYSGKAVYKNTFKFKPQSEPSKRIWLVLNDVKDTGIASVQLNGKPLGITWTPPFRVDATSAIQPGDNHLTIVVVNSWRNRLIGDRELPKDKQRTNTNITVRPDWKLEDSGLLGPVQLLASD